MTAIVQIVQPTRSAKQSAPFSIEIWSDPDDFLQRATDWNALADRAAPDNVFLRHEWFAAAWQWLRHDAELRVLGIREAGRLVGIAPLIRRQGGSRRLLCFMTVPDTQSCTLIAAADVLQPVVSAVVETLRTRLTDWDELQLTHLDSPSAALQALQEAFTLHGLRHVARPQGDNPCVSLDDNWNTYYARRSRRLKKGNNLIANSLGRRTQRIALDQIGVAQRLDEAAIAKLLEILVDLSAHSWKHTTGLTLDYAGPQAFFRALTQIANQRGWLSVWLLWLGEEAVAMEYQLRYHGHVHALRADYRADHAELSPGSYLNWKMLEQLFASTDRKYWMGPGNNPYKQRWAESGQQLTTLIAFNTTPWGRWLAVRELALRPLYQRLRTLLRAPVETKA